MKIRMGSTYFFAGLENFVVHDEDFITLVEQPTDFKICKHIRFINKFCHFYWKKMTPEEFIKVTLESSVPMQVGKFLIKEFNEQIGFTIEHLKQLEPIFYKLDDKHKYEKVIYDCYILNNDFVLSDEQRQLAYKEYLKYRQ